MKIIKLYGMVLENFKSVSKLDVDFNGQDVDVYGDNKAGKTTLFDAFLWVLFGKDSKNRKDFQIKTIVDGEEIHNVEHSVSIKLQVDDELIELKRVYKEVYKKGKTAAEKIFNGHKTFYYVNEVPFKEKDYKAKIDSIVEEEVFKLITNPFYFNQLDWKEQRKILFALSEGVEFDPIESNKDLYILKDLLNKYSFNEALAMYKAKRLRIKNEIETIPTRIDELQKSVNDYSASSNDAENQIIELENKSDSLKQQINKIQNGEAASVIKNELLHLQMDLSNRKNELKQLGMLEVNKLLTKLEEIQGNGQIIQGKYLDLSSEIKRKNFELNLVENEISDNEVLIQRLKNDFADLDKKKFNLNDYIDVCKACNTPLEVMEEEEALQLFKISIKKTKDSINEKGISIRNSIDSLKDLKNQIVEFINKKSEECNKQKDLLDKAKKDKDKFQDKINELKSVEIDFSNDEIILKKMQEIEAKKSRLEEIEVLNEEIVKNLNEEINKLKLDKEKLNASLSKKYAAIEAQKRIEELNYKLEGYLIEFDDSERYIYLLEQYNRENVENLSKTINDLFEITDFKLFKRLVNGDYEETCEALHENILYSKGLNTASQINVGLDIINVLSSKYQVIAPIFVDNAESSTNILKTKGQQIRMYVAAGKKQLEFKGDK